MSRHLSRFALVRRVAPTARLEAERLLPVFLRGVSTNSYGVAMLLPSLLSELLPSCVGCLHLKRRPLSCYYWQRGNASQHCHSERSEESASPVLVARVARIPSGGESLVCCPGSQQPKRGSLLSVASVACSRSEGHSVRRFAAALARSRCLPAGRLSRRSASPRSTRQTALSHDATARPRAY